MQALGDVLSAQKTAFETNYKDKMGHLEGLESAIRKLTATYTRDKAQLDKDIAENKEKQHKLDKLLLRLEASEVQSMAREKELESEMGRLTAGYTSEVQELHEKHKREIADCTTSFNVMKDERDVLEQEKSRLALKLQELEEQTSEELESLRLERTSLQKDLEQTVSQNSSLMHQLNALQTDLQVQHLQDSEQREKIQSMMVRLEANGNAVAEKQRQLEEKEELLKEAGTDLEHRLVELITLVSESIVRFSLVKEIAKIRSHTDTSWHVGGRNVSAKG
jgi:chromosome segregation ATPase